MRVVIVDDDRLVCDSLRVILDAQDDVEVVALGTTGDDAVRLFAQHAPDVMLLDIQMPGRDGLSAAEEILAAHPDARVVFLTTFSDDEYIVRALRLGARGYLIKQDVSAIAPALRSVMRGQSVLEGKVLERVSSMGAVGRAAGAAPGGGSAADDGADAGPAGPVPARPAGRLAAFACLTEREYQVVELVAEGLDNREIAARVCMGEGTVRNHISMILAKLDLRNRTQIAVAYYRALRG